MELNSKVIKFVILSVVLLAGAAAVTFAAYLKRPDGILADGVRVAGMDWSNKPVEIARAELEAWRTERIGKTVTLATPADEKGRRRMWTPTRARLGADVDVEATLADAQKVGEDDGALARFLSWFSGTRQVDLAPRWQVDEKKARNYLRGAIAPTARRPERNARFLALPQGFRIVPERAGRELDLDAATALIKEQLPKETTGVLMLSVRDSRPHVTAADLRGIEGEVARFSTDYSERGNRARNIATACEKINGTVLKPGDIFSYNDVVGPRDSEAGFRLAPVIVRGRLEPGLGGGVCQTSSTLFNAVLLADLKIVRRQHHAFPVHYLPAGRDATVAYGSIDFQFQNNTDAPIAIAANGRGGQVLMRVFGRKVPGREVHIERTGVSSWSPGSTTVRDSSLSEGVRRTVESGKRGHRVTVWRIVKVQGRQVKRELIARDTYRAIPSVVAVGTRRVVRRPTAPVVPDAGSVTASPDAGTGPVNGEETLPD